MRVQWTCPSEHSHLTVWLGLEGPPLSSLMWLLAGSLNSVQHWPPHQVVCILTTWQAASIRVNVPGGNNKEPLCPLQLSHTLPISPSVIYEKSPSPARTQGLEEVASTFWREEHGRTCGTLKPPWFSCINIEISVRKDLFFTMLGLLLGNWIGKILLH